MTGSGRGQMKRGQRLWFVSVVPNKYVNISLREQHVP